MTETHSDIIRAPKRSQRGLSGGRFPLLMVRVILTSEGGAMVAGAAAEGFRPDSAFSVKLTAWLVASAVFAAMFLMQWLLARHRLRGSGGGG